MADDLLGGFPPRGAKDGNNIVFIHNYNNVNVVSQGSNAQFTGAINDPTEGYIFFKRDDIHSRHYTVLKTVFST